MGRSPDSHMQTSQSEHNTHLYCIRQSTQGFSNSFREIASALPKWLIILVCVIFFLVLLSLRHVLPKLFWFTFNNVRSLVMSSFPSSIFVEKITIYDMLMALIVFTFLLISIYTLIVYYEPCDRFNIVSTAAPSSAIQRSSSLPPNNPQKTSSYRQNIPSTQNNASKSDKIKEKQSIKSQKGKRPDVFRHSRSFHRTDEKYDDAYYNTRTVGDLSLKNSLSFAHFMAVPEVTPEDEKDSLVHVISALDNLPSGYSHITVRPEDVPLPPSPIFTSSEADDIEQIPLCNLSIDTEIDSSDDGSNSSGSDTDNSIHGNTQPHISRREPDSISYPPEYPVNISHNHVLSPEKYAPVSYTEQYNNTSEQFELIKNLVQLQQQTQERYTSTNLEKSRNILAIFVGTLRTLLFAAFVIIMITFIIFDFGDFVTNTVYDEIFEEYQTYKVNIIKPDFCDKMGVFNQDDVSWRDKISQSVGLRDHRYYTNKCTMYKQATLVDADRLKSDLDQIKEGSLSTMLAYLSRKQRKSRFNLVIGWVMTYVGDFLKHLVTFFTLLGSDISIFDLPSMVKSSVLVLLSFGSLAVVFGLYYSVSRCCGNAAHYDRYQMGPCAYCCHECVHCTSLCCKKRICCFKDEDLMLLPPSRQMPLVPDPQASFVHNKYGQAYTDAMQYQYQLGAAALSNISQSKVVQQGYHQIPFVPHPLQAAHPLLNSRPLDTNDESPYHSRRGFHTYDYNAHNRPSFSPQPHSVPLEGQHHFPQTNSHSGRKDKKEKRNKHYNTHI